MYKTFAWLCLALFLAPFSSPAQDWLGMQVSSYTGMHAALNNPAMLGLARNKLQIGILGTNSQISTNMLRYKGSKGIGTIFKGYELSGEAYDNLKNSNLGDGLNSIFSLNNWERVKNSDNKDFSITSEIRGPFIAGTVGPMGWGIGYRAKGGLQFRDVSATIADLFFSGLKEADPILLGTALKDKQFSASVNAYHEFYGTFAFPLAHIGPHYLGGGGTLKYLAGMYSASVVNRGLDYTLLANDSILTTQADLSYQYIDNPVFAADPTAARGSGLGVDLGVVYELRGYNEAGAQYGVGQGTHKIRAGLSMIDLGQIAYSGKGTRKFDFKNVRIPTTWGSIDTLKLKGAAGLDSLFSQVFGSTNEKGRFTTNLPTVINVFGDVQLYKWFYVAASASQSLVGVSKTGLRAFSSITVIPRFESKMVEFSLPMSIGNNYKYFQPGFYARVSGFYFGSDNLSTFFSAQNRTGISFYIGGFVPLYRSE